MPTLCSRIDEIWRTDPRVLSKRTSRLIESLAAGTMIGTTTGAKIVFKFAWNIEICFLVIEIYWKSMSIEKSSDISAIMFFCSPWSFSMVCGVIGEVIGWGCGEAISRGLFSLLVGSLGRRVLNADWLRLLTKWTEGVGSRHKGPEVDSERHASNAKRSRPDQR